jgi:hypothetical protein
MRGVKLSLTLVVALVACGSEGGPAGSSSPGPGTIPTTVQTTTSPTADGGPLSDSIVGLWSVSGSDARGDYDGEVEVRPDTTAGASAASYTFIRSIHYKTATVEDGREL